MADETNIAKYTSLWIGAFFFWALIGFGKKYEEFLIKKFDKRNIITGYLITLILITLLVYLAFFKQ